MTKTVIDLGKLVEIGESPLPKTIDEIDVSFKTSDGATIHGILTRPNDRPITQKALHLHEIEGQADGGPSKVISHRYAHLGIATLRIDFSGHGKRKDEWDRYSPASMLKDAKESLDWLDNKFPDIEQTILGGFSTGGGIAILLRALDDRISKTCLLYPVLSFRNNFLAAAYNDSDLAFPIDSLDIINPWRAIAFPKEKIVASLDEDKPFALTAHKYGSKFIKGCRDFIEAGDIESTLFIEGLSPLTIIQGTEDRYVPHILARVFHSQIQNAGSPFRLVSMKGMDHYVPPVWKQSVLKQFIKAATQPDEDFSPHRTVVTLQPQQKGFVDLNALLQQHKDQGLVRQIG